MTMVQLLVLKNVHVGVSHNGWSDSYFFWMKVDCSELSHCETSYEEEFGE